MLQNDNIMTCMPEAIVNYLCRNNSEKRLGITGSRKMREYRNLTTVDHHSRVVRRQEHGLKKSGGGRRWTIMFLQRN